MANVKNFGLVGVGSDLQFGKAGTRLVNNAGTFSFKAADGTTAAALTAAGITSTAGNVTLTTGNLVLTDVAGKLTVGGLDLIQRSAGGVPQISGTAGVLVPTGDTAARATGVTGMVRVNNDVPSAAVVEYFNGTAWSSLATSGNAQALQTEVNAIETTLGSMINTDGSTNVATALTATQFGGATDLTTALQNLASAVDGKNTLDEIFPSAAAGGVIYAGAGNTWLQAAPGVTSGVQAYSKSLDALAAKTSTGFLVQTAADTYSSVALAVSGGLTISDEFGLAGTTTFGTTGNLAAVNALAGTGFTVRTTGDVWTQRSLASTATGISFSNANGVDGNPTLDVSGNIAQLDGLASVGFLVRHTDGTLSTESITGTAGRIVVSSGNGDTVAPSIDLAEVSQAATGTFSKVTLDGYGRVVGNTAVTTADITALVDATYVNVAGDTMTGALDLGGFALAGVGSPVLATDAANKAYVDNAVTGLTWKTAVDVLAADPVALAGTAPLTIDGSVLATGARVLVTGNGVDNGIYTYTVTGSSYALTRATDADVFGELNGASVFVMSGTVYQDSGWVQSAPLTAFADQAWVQFSGAGAYSAGTAIDLTGTTFSVKTGNGITTVADNIALDIAVGTALSAATGPLAIVLDATATGGLDQTSGALRVKAGGITNAMLATSGITLNADTGTGLIDLGATLTIAGTSGQGIAVSVSGTDPATFVVTASDASTTQKGVATFNAGDFEVTAGDVTIKAGGVDNTQLVNSSFSLAGDAASAGSVSLGGTFTVTGADTAITATASAAGIALQLNTVDVAHGGTGLTTLAATQLLIGNGTSAVAQSANLAFAADVLTVGGALPLAFNGATGSITATATNSDIVLMPNGSGSVVVGPIGAGLIQSDVGTSLTVRGNTELTLEAGTGNVVLKLASGTSKKVDVSGPTASDYATGLVDSNLVNKLYVDTAISTGAASGSIKAVKAVVSLDADGTTNIGAAIPAGATVLSVKVLVNSVDAAATLSIGAGSSIARYMTTVENDPQTSGIYMAEVFDADVASVQLFATVASTAATVGGKCTVIVQYQVAEIA